RGPTVPLTRGNDTPQTMKDRQQKLLPIRVKPYYIYQCDFAKGVNHFRTKISKGVELISAIRGHTSGLAVPHYVVDAPGGGGKIPVQPDYVVEKSDSEIVLRNYRGNTYRYPEPKE
ncbi:MAG: lysine 2,3-aminomutase, partial [Candidatus Altiarchaeota archaeon]